MKPIIKSKETSKEFDDLKTRLKTTWMTGDYDLFSRFMEKDTEHSLAYGPHITRPWTIAPGSTPNTSRLLRLAAEDKENSGINEVSTLTR